MCRTQSLLRQQPRVAESASVPQNCPDPDLGTWPNCTAFSASILTPITIIEGECKSKLTPDQTPEIQSRDRTRVTEVPNIKAVHAQSLMWKMIDLSMPNMKWVGENEKERGKTFAVIMQEVDLLTGEKEEAESHSSLTTHRCPRNFIASSTAQKQVTPPRHAQ